MDAGSVQNRPGRKKLRRLNSSSANAKRLYPSKRTYRSLPSCFEKPTFHNADVLYASPGKVILRLANSCLRRSKLQFTTNELEA